MEINMTIKNRGIQRFISLAMIVVGCGFLAGCSQIDVTTEEGLLKALKTRQKLDKAIPKISGMITRPNEMKTYVPALVELYNTGSSFDREVIQALAASRDPAAYPALKKAVSSPDYKQVMQAAMGIKDLQNAEGHNDAEAKEIQASLLSLYDKQVNPEVQRVILETGTTIKSDAITQKAIAVLNGKIDDTPFSLLRTSCDVLAFQKDPKAVDTLMRVVYHQDGVGRTLTTNCTRALLALDKAVVAPVLLKAYKLENKELMQYVEAHPDTLTPETLRNNTANALALYRYEEAVEPMLDYISNTRTIPVPGTLAIRPPTDPAWQMWASLVGVAAQSTLFSLNDIGVRNNERAKTVLMDIFNWTTPYQAKFKNAIELTGTTNIEVSQRVNAFRTLRENDLLSNAEILEMINSLKGEEFLDERTWRPYARASIATDMITYCSVTSKAGDTGTIWAAFNAMKANEFKVPEPEDPDAPKVPHYNDSIFARIDAVKPAFELADKCDTNAACYAEALKNPNIDGYARVKAIYELGLSGDHNYFSTVCDQYKNLDVFGQLYGTKALAQLGTKADVETIKELNKTLAREMNQIQYQAAKPNLEGLVTTLESKAK